STRASSIIPVSAKHGRGTPWTSFLAVPLEEAIRSLLVEVKAAEISGDDAPARHRVELLAGELANLDSLAAKWQAKMNNEAIREPVAGQLAEIRIRRKALAEDLAQAQREAASPVSEAWGEFRTQASLDPKKDTDDLRLRIRAALRRAVESIHCVF